MINRRSFLHLVRNRVAAGVLCSGMLTDALDRYVEPEISWQPWAEEYFESITTVADFTHVEILNNAIFDRLQGVGLTQQLLDFQKEIRAAKERWNEHGL